MQNKTREDRTITFTTESLSHLKPDSKYRDFRGSSDHKTMVYIIKKFTNYNVVTTCLHLLSFDLLEKFDKIFLVHNTIQYELKLGENDWTAKYLRMQHNLFKIVMNEIVNK
jgi:hypothetical protein